MEYYDIDFAQIILIKDLWERNREFHKEKSKYFKWKYEQIEFEQRMEKFKEDAKDDYKITLVKNNKKHVGYCISTISNRIGEIESLHVLESERGFGIGKMLMNKHIEWMKENKCEKIGVTVMMDNESTIEFYKSMGFKSDTIYMQLL